MATANRHHHVEFPIDIVMVETNVDFHMSIVDLLRSATLLREH